jgi:hypothetical protein
MLRSRIRVSLQRQVSRATSLLHAVKVDLMDFKARVWGSKSPLLSLARSTQLAVEQDVQKLIKQEQSAVRV